MRRNLEGREGDRIRIISEGRLLALFDVSLRCSKSAAFWGIASAFTLIGGPALGSVAA